MYSKHTQDLPLCTGSSAAAPMQLMLPCHSSSYMRKAVKLCGVNNNLWPSTRSSPVWGYTG